MKERIFIMKLVYASRTGNVQKLVDRIAAADALKIASGDESVKEDYILITYTDGAGIIPPSVEKFLDANHESCKGVAVSGNSERHTNTFCFAADKIADKYGLPILVKFEKDGDATAEAAVRAALQA